MILGTLCRGDEDVAILTDAGWRSEDDEMSRYLNVRFSLGSTIGLSPILPPGLMHLAEASRVIGCEYRYDLPVHPGEEVQFPTEERQ